MKIPSRWIFLLLIVMAAVNVFAAWVNWREDAPFWVLVVSLLAAGFILGLAVAHETNMDNER